MFEEFFESIAEWLCIEHAGDYKEWCTACQIGENLRRCWVKWYAKQTSKKAN